MDRILESIISYWSAGGWVCLPLAGVSFCIWYYVLRGRRAVLGALAWEGAGLAPAEWDRAAQRLEERLSRDLVVLAAWTAVAPLLGLAGTVAGMIQTFLAVARVAGDTGPRVAGGISQALITTQAGLAIAIPGLFGLASLRRLVVQVRARVSAMRIERLQMHAAGTEAA